MLLAWPVPLWLQRAKWPSQAPGAALVLWQAIGISGGLALVSAPLTWGLQPFADGILPALAELWQVYQTQGLNAVLTDPRWHTFGLAAITLSLLLFAHLALVLLHTTYRTFRQRKKHRQFVELLSASLQDENLNDTRSVIQVGHTRVLPVEHPLAYCLPAMNQPMTVVSQGLLEELTPRQLAAVLAHESAHLKQRHDLLRLAFEAWHKAAPWFPATGVAVNEVTELTEIMADDYALTKHDRQDLTTALAHTAQGHNDSSTSSSVPPPTPDTTSFSRRINRLTKPEKSWGSGRVSLVIILAVLLVTVPAVVSLV